MINRDGKIGGEGRWAHTARHDSEMSAVVDRPCMTSRWAKELRRKSRTAIVRSDLWVVRKRGGGRQNGRGSSRAGAHSFFTTFFGFAASVRMMMTRYAANAKQTNEPFSSHLRRTHETQGMSSEQSRGLKDKRRGRRFKCAGWEGCLPLGWPERADGG